MRIFRWLLLIANTITVMEVVFSLLVGPRSVPVAAIFIVAWIIAPVLANIVFILITWRWRHEGKAVGRITGVFD